MRGRFGCWASAASMSTAAERAALAARQLELVEPMDMELLLLRRSRAAWRAGQWFAAVTDRRRERMHPRPATQDQIAWCLNTGHY